MDTFHLDRYSYDLPKELIAQKSASPRNHSRLMAVAVQDCAIAHAHFFELERFLRKGDLIVMNDSKVIPARLFGKKETGGAVEVLLVREESGGRWSALLRNIKKSDVGKKVLLGAKGELTCIPEVQQADGTWLIRFSVKGKRLSQLLARLGSAPTPPYVEAKIPLARYQTVYARKEGSVAAPTAGFHFTQAQIDALKRKGIRFCTVTLHVGPGTFLPIRSEDIRQHAMHPERAEVSRRAASLITRAREEGRRIIAVGTTSVRVLEGFVDQQGCIAAGKRDINIYIYPGYRFKAVDALITNFHLPKSTLLLLVSAFGAYKKKGGAECILSAYKEAVRMKYRFYSFGDAMMIL